MMDFDYYEEYTKQNIIMAVLIKKRKFLFIWHLQTDKKSLS